MAFVYIHRTVQDLPCSRARHFLRTSPFQAVGKNWQPVVFRERARSQGAALLGRARTRPHYVSVHVNVETGGRRRRGRPLCLASWYRWISEFEPGILWERRRNRLDNTRNDEVNLDLRYYPTVNIRIFNTTSMLLIHIQLVIYVLRA